MDVCLGKSKWERELHQEGQDFTLVPSRSSSSNGAEAAAKEQHRVAEPLVCMQAVSFSRVSV